MKSFAATIILQFLLPLGAAGLIIPSRNGARSCHDRASKKVWTPLMLYSQDIVYDGSEWASIKDCLIGEGQSSLSLDAPYGHLQVVVGKDDAGQRVVGVRSKSSDDEVIELKDENVAIHKDSMAVVPKGISDKDAAATLVASLAGVHCAAPKQRVGGSSDTFGWGKAVVVGGNNYACFVADGLAALGADVSLVSTKSPRPQSEDVNVLKHAVGDDEIGFASFIGDFDSLVDTIGDERGSGPRGPTLRQLEAQNGCEKYLSTMTESQRIVLKEGIFFGPGKAKKHAKSLEAALKQNSKDIQYIQPPASFGKTLQTLLDKKILWKPQLEGVVRGWTMQDFIELTTWPTDASDLVSVRFGFPVPEEIVRETTVQVNGETFLVAEPPAPAKPNFIYEGFDDMEDFEEDFELTGEESSAGEANGQVVSKNPYVEQIIGIEGVEEVIEKAERHAILFVSATWCRTCKVLDPRFTSMAKIQQSDANNDLVFAKVDTTGPIGREVSKKLGLRSVPAFILYRNGRRFGSPLALSKLPSPQLSVAIDLLESGKDWDRNAVFLKDSV